MLEALSIADFAIIDRLDLVLDRGLTVITGETGAGKSVLIYALDLVLGSRARTEVVRTGAEAAGPLAQLDAYLAAAGRTRADIGIEPRIAYGDGDPDEWAAIVAGWEDAGATHMTMQTMRVGLSTPGEHLEAMRTFAAAIGLSR